MREVQKLFRKIFGHRYPDKHRVLLLWRSPLYDTLEHRSAAFEEYAEAEEWAAGLKRRYTEEGWAFVIFVDGHIFYRTEEDVRFE